MRATKIPFHLLYPRLARGMPPWSEGGEEDEEEKKDDRGVKVPQRGCVRVWWVGVPMSRCAYGVGTDYPRCLRIPQSFGALKWEVFPGWMPTETPSGEADRRRADMWALLLGSTLNGTSTSDIWLCDYLSKSIRALSLPPPPHNGR